MGLALIAAAVVVSAHQGNVIHGDVFTLALGVVVAIIGLGITISGAFGRSAGALGGIAIVLALIAAPLAQWGDFMSGTDRPQVTAFSDSNFTPTGGDEPNRGYVFIASDADLDLTQYPLPETGTLTVPVRVAASDLTITLPRGVAAIADVQFTAGEVRWQIPVEQKADSGLHRSRTFQTPAVSEANPPVLELQVRGAATTITIKEN